jgi:hypothetical protein
MSDPGTTRSNEFTAFDRLMRKLIAVPKKELDKKVAAFKRRKKKSRVR